MADPTDWGDQATDWVAAAISRYRYKPRYQWPTMTEKEREFLRGEARVAIEAVRETEIYALWRVPLGTQTVGWGMTAQVDRNPEGHDPAEGHGRNDESPVAATSGDAPKLCPKGSTHG